MQTPAPFTVFNRYRLAEREPANGSLSIWEMTAMARVSWMQRLYWRYMSQPAGHRDVFLHAIEQPIGSILEIGMGSGERIRTLLKLFQLPAEVKQLRYAAIDPFESAERGPSTLTLKAAHRLLHEHGVKAHLLPGDITSGVMRVAHTVLPSDLVIIDGFWGNGSPEAEVIVQWLPRLCHSRSSIFGCSVPGGRLDRLNLPGATIDSTVRSQAA